MGLANVHQRHLLIVLYLIESQLHRCVHVQQQGAYSRNHPWYGHESKPYYQVIA